ncbi:MAG TPA: hypothetical protein PLL72_13180 [Burkholderiaceae bacterium]|nr:hypothetical protein [Burkholderiaceae bacterium]
MLLRQALSQERTAHGDELLLPGAPTREQIVRFEELLLQAEAQGHGVELGTWHHFADGLVARTILIPAGTVLTGAAHKAEHLNIAVGDITVWTEAGMRRLTGHHVLPSQPGAKRVGYAHADTWWTTVHANPKNERDVSVLEDTLVEDSGRLQSRRLTLGTTPVVPLEQHA